MTREDWLLRAADGLHDLVLKPNAFALPAHLWLSVGFPGGRGGKKAKAIGQCWPRQASSDQHGHIFIHPMLIDSTRVLDVLLHEIGHDIIGCEHGHRAPFASFCKRVDLLKPWTATTAGTTLAPRLNTIIDSIGPYPHAALTTLAEAKKPGSRLRLYECPACTQKVRAASDTLSIRCNDCTEDFILIPSKGA